MPRKRGRLTRLRGPGGASRRCRRRRYNSGIGASSALRLPGCGCPAGTLRLDTGSAGPTSVGTFLLPAYAAIFLGATSIQPGRFNALGTGIAVLFLATGVAGLQLLGAQDYAQQLFYGAALVLAVTISRYLRRN